MRIPGPGHALKFAAIASVAIVTSPIVTAVSLAAASVFAVKSIYSGIVYKRKFLATKNGCRTKFGCEPSQDYTRYDGKVVSSQDWYLKKQYDHSGEYLSGKENLQSPTPTQFSDKDLKWLKDEKARLNQKEHFINNLKWTRAFAKSTIPFIGLFWALYSETNNGGVSSLPACEGCQEGSLQSRFKHHHTWTRLEAVEHHIKQIEKSIGSSIKNNEGKKRENEEKLDTKEPFSELKNHHLNAVKEDGNNLKYVDGKFKDDRDIVLAAVKQKGLSLIHI